jgi:hypothetical protein
MASGPSLSASQVQPGRYGLLIQRFLLDAAPEPARFIVGNDDLQVKVAQVRRPGRGNRFFGRAMPVIDQGALFLWPLEAVEGVPGVLPQAHQALDLALRCGGRSCGQDRRQDGGRHSAQQGATVNVGHVFTLGSGLSKARAGSRPAAGGWKPAERQAGRF